MKQVEARPGANANRAQTGSNRDQHRRRTQCLRPSAQRSIFVLPDFNPCAIRFHALGPAFQFKFPINDAILYFLRFERQKGAVYLDRYCAMEQKFVLRAMH